VLNRGEPRGEFNGPHVVCRDIADP
jgi:hypothetical protein